MTVFISDVRLGDRFVEIRKEVFKECFPASALITVTGFARPGIMVEVQGIAVNGEKDTQQPIADQYLKECFTKG